MPEFSIVTAVQPKGLVLRYPAAERKFLHKVDIGSSSTHPSIQFVLGGCFPKDKVARHEAYQSPPIW